MGRLRKYMTKEEQREAHLRYVRNYYQKNKKKINKKAMRKYYEKKKEESSNLQDN